MKQPLQPDSRQRPAPRPKHYSLGNKTTGPPGEVRIIGGSLKRRKLPVPNVPGLRPTPDRVRETLFNWLGQDLTGWRCMDAFAGTGALGLECASRGAAQVLLVEQNPALADALKAQVLRLGCETSARVQRGDGLGLLGQHRAAFELVLLDPPFDAAWSAKALPLALQALVPGGFVYWESRALLNAEQLETLGATLHRHLKAGLVHAHLLQAC